MLLPNNNGQNNGFYFDAGETANDLGDWIGLGSARREREFNSAEAEKQRNWEETMSNTAYQRAVEDMKKAGLNPALMYAGGSNMQASTPGGGTAHSSAANVGGLNGIANIVHSAASLIGVSKDSKNYKTLSNSASDLVKTASLLAKMFL